MTTPCPVPPLGWRCTREAGHEGPCAALPATTPALWPSPAAVLTLAARLLRSAAYHLRTDAAEATSATAVVRLLLRAKLYDAGAKACALAAAEGASGASVG